jgi:hypothetical protein
MDKGALKKALIAINIPPASSMHRTPRRTLMGINAQRVVFQ